MRNGRTPNRARAGFTLVEVSVASTIFLMIGVAVSHTVKIADGSQGTVQEMSEENRGHREAVAELMDELRTAGSDTLEIVEDQNGNHVLSFQQLVEVNGELKWGVEDPIMGTQEGWSVRYLVDTDQQLEAAGPERRLVRQVLNSEESLERELEVLDSLSDEGPAFKVDAAGSMWEVKLVTAGAEGGQENTSVFHVRPRN